MFSKPMKTTKEHICAGETLANDSETKIIYGPTVDKEWDSWIFQISSIADQKEVEMGEAEYVGELLYQTQLAIAYCPFCGKRLGDGHNEA